MTLPSIGLGLVPTGIDSVNSNNPPPKQPIYPTVAGSGNPSYTVKESVLRSAMYFPKDWPANLGKEPVILVPGTGTYGVRHLSNCGA
jgi:hypothetical protein